MRYFPCGLLLILISVTSWAGEAVVAPGLPPAVAGASAPDSLPVMPPSPSTAPGKRIWPDPVFTHWPAIAYGDELNRHVAFSLPVQKAGVAGSIHWAGQPPAAITLPAQTDAVSGLLFLPVNAGDFCAEVMLGDKKWKVLLRVVSAHDPWPIARLTNGFPVDEKGLPVVLLDRKRQAEDERRFWLLDQSQPRPQGKPWLVGDPLAAMGDDAWSGLEAERRPAFDERYPQHAVMVALAGLPAGPTAPRSIVWCPGNQVLYGGAWAEEEERLMGALVSRCEHLKIGPRLIVALPPMPMEENLAKLATQRRELLARCATHQGWVVTDLGSAAGDPLVANRWADHVYTRYPQGAAQKRMRKALAEALER